MKPVLTLLTVTVLAVANAQNCPVRTYTEYLVPNCASGETDIMIPDYTNVTQYWSCYSIGNPVKQTCPATAPYFCYVFQECTSCADYIPAVTCSELSLPSQQKCLPINGATSPSPGGSTTGYPTPIYPDGGSTTPSPTTPSPTTTGTTTSRTTTTRSTATTTTSAATVSTATSTMKPIVTPPTETTTSSPGGISIPPPPSPSTLNPNVLTPPTPIPTPPVIENAPPTVNLPVIA